VLQRGAEALRSASVHHAARRRVLVALAALLQLLRLCRCRAARVRVPSAACAWSAACAQTQSCEHACGAPLSSSCPGACGAAGLPRRAAGSSRRRMLSSERRRVAESVGSPIFAAATPS
jgi:hypothetical protein